MKKYFYLGQEKFLRLFVETTLKTAHHEIYTTDSLDELYVIQDLDSKKILIDSAFFSKLPENFFEKSREYFFIIERGETGHQQFVGHSVLEKPLSPETLLAL